MSEVAPSSHDAYEGERRRLLQPLKTGSSAGMASSSSSYDGKTAGTRDKSEVEKTEKQKYLEFAVYSLEFMLITFMTSIILATFLTIFYEMNPSYMPLWIIFSVIWLGHVINFGASIRVVQLLFRSLIPGYEKDKLTNKVLRTNEKRIALAQFTLFNLLW